MTEPLKRPKAEAWFFDIETAPCADTIRKIYNLGGIEDQEAILFAFEKAGATYENPQPFLKTVMQKIVCISILCRQITSNGVTLTLKSYPDADVTTEKEIIETVLGKIGTRKPQLIGYNSAGFDLTVLYQRAIIHGLSIPKFCERPDKPWDAMPDYFSASNAWNVDLCKTVGGWGKETPSLVEICRACGISAKPDGNGSDVLAMFDQGKIREIIDYCESDVIATYHLWLRLAETCGYLCDEEASSEGSKLITLLAARTQTQGATA